jgi:hypothetical protein
VIPETQTLKGDKADDKSSKAESSKAVDLSRFGEFVDVVCYNCGTPGHHKVSYKKPRFCFICRKEDHVVDQCPVKKQGHRCASYIGSVASGLGFYHIEISEVQEKVVMDFTNCGLVYVEEILPRRNCNWN